MASRSVSHAPVLAFNKPNDVLSQFSVPGNAKPGQRTLSDFIPVPGIYPAGRLDRDSEGLLLLTADGALAHRLTDPSHGHRRTYLVQVEGEITARALEVLQAGTIELGGTRCRKADAHVVAPPTLLWERDPPIRRRLLVPTSWIELVLTEGKNRQVRRMTAAVGFPTLRLVRWASAGIELGGLASGTWRWLDSDEQELLVRR